MKTRTCQPPDCTKIDTANVSSLEIIDETKLERGERVYRLDAAKNIEAQLQDRGKTLKIFISKM